VGRNQATAPIAVSCCVIIARFAASASSPCLASASIAGHHGGLTALLTGLDQAIRGHGGDDVEVAEVFRLARDVAPCAIAVFRHDGELLFLTGPLQYLPRFVLAAIVFNIAIGLIDRRGLVEILRESPGEFVLAIGTALIVSGDEALVEGILLAVGLSLLRHVRQSYRPHTSVLAPGPTGRWVSVPAVSGVQTEPALLVYHFGADLFYANANLFTDEVHSLIRHAPTPVRWLVIDAVLSPRSTSPPRGRCMIFATICAALVSTSPLPASTPICAPTWIAIGSPM
jgi:hypothetical protein